MPLIGATQGQHNWWTKGLGGSRRTLRNWTGGWTTAKSVAKEGRKVKPILPTTTSRFTDRKTRRTKLTRLKPAEDFSFFPPFPLNSFFLSVHISFFYSFFLPSFTFFIPSSSLLLFILFFQFLLKFLLILPPIFLYSFFLPSFPFLFHFSLFPFSFFFFFLPSFSFSHRWDNKTWSAEKTRVRPCYTHKHQLKTSEHRRLRRQHHWIPLAFYHRSSYHKPRESEQIRFQKHRLTRRVSQTMGRQRNNPQMQGK